jgi:hypothetical protein
MAKGKMKFVVKSELPAVKSAVGDFCSQARDKALKAGVAAANDSLKSTNAAKDYNLPVDVTSQTDGKKKGAIGYPHFYGGWFEYGTVFIGAVPFIRPGGQAMAKAFQQETQDNVENAVAKKVDLGS